MRGPAFFAYADNYLVDVKFGVIVDVEATRAIRQAEVGAAKTMIDRTEQRLGLKPQRLAADSAYGVNRLLAGLDRIKSGFTSRFANRLPIFGASRLPRLANGRSLSGNAVSSQLDFAWRMRNSVFMPRSIPICAVRPVTTGWKRRTIRQKLQSAVLVWAQPAAARGPDPALWRLRARCVATASSREWLGPVHLNWHRE